MSFSDPLYATISYENKAKHSSSPDVEEKKFSPLSSGTLLNVSNTKDELARSGDTNRSWLTVGKWSDEEDEDDVDDVGVRGMSFMQPGASTKKPLQNATFNDVKKEQKVSNLATADAMVHASTSKATKQVSTRQIIITFHRNTGNVT